MGYYNLDITMHRIKTAKRASPIAVFLGPPGLLRSVFAATVASKKDIIQAQDRYDRRYIGTFHWEMEMNSVRSQIQMAMDTKQTISKPSDAKKKIFNSFLEGRSIIDIAGEGIHSSDLIEAIIREVLVWDKSKETKKRLKKQP